MSAVVLWFIHTARDRDRDHDRDRDRETMDFYIALCTIHTTQGQEQRTYCAHPGPCFGPLQCV